MRQRGIAVVSLSGTNGATDLRASLEKAGYQTTTQRTIEHAELAIVFLGGDGCNREVVDAIRQLALRGPLLCVFHESCANRCPEILASCTDFLQWPCTEGELVRRLELCGVGDPSTHSPIAADVANEFVNLSLVGESPPFVSFLLQLKKAAQYGAPVLIEGETGTGKELAARAIHYLGARRDCPFVPVNCGAIPDDLFENELFGHEKGAFTDAREPQEGLISLAEGGTMFLDEVEALSARAQVKLLRFLQNYDFKPLGGQRVRRANIRTIAASNTPLDELVAQKAFRSDLLYRLRVVHLEPPPLRKRNADVELLARHFLRHFANLYGGPFRRLSGQTLGWMSRYGWPGNVRELENLIHQSYIASDEPVIHLSRPDGLQSDVGGKSTAGDGSFRRAKAEVINDFEVSYLTRLMTECQGNVTLAADKAGKERRAFGKLLKKHRIAAAG